MLSENLQQKINQKLTQNPFLIKNLSKLIHTLGLIAGLGVFLFRLLKKPELRKPQTHTTDENKIQQLSEKRELYRQHMADMTDHNGFVLYYECDSTLFSGLVGCDPKVAVNLEAAIDLTGAWTRRPVDARGCDTCYPQHSKSSISRDMFVGVLWYIWHNKRLDLAEDIYAYGEKNSWIMGKGAASRIVFSPGLRSILAEIIYRLGGKNRPIVRSIPHFVTKNNGFAAHLEVLTSGLRADLLGGADKQILDTLEYHALRQPHNALFNFFYHQYTSTNQDWSIGLLMDEKHFPNSRLPERKDRKEFWLFQRDEDDSGWLPDQKSEKHPHPVHAGADLVFLSHLILD